MKRTKGKGVTLVEVLVVIAIIGILIALLVPVVQGFSNAAKRANQLRLQQDSRVTTIVNQRTNLITVEHDGHKFIVVTDDYNVTCAVHHPGCVCIHDAAEKE